MLSEVSAEQFENLFNIDPHPFISSKFIELNKHKVEKIVRLVKNQQKVSIGLIAGIKEGVLKAPFSAPFGGFHYRNESIYISEIEQFIEDLLLYVKKHEIHRINLTLPPAIYQKSFNAKVVNAMIRYGFRMDLPEITSWVKLQNFKEKFTYKNSGEYYRQAIRNNLKFYHINDIDIKKSAYELIRQNRILFGRPIHMDFDDIISTSKIWQVDFWGVKNPDGLMIASGIFYQFPSKIAYAVLWGDNETGRPLRAMDFLVFNLLTYYKSAFFEYIDLGISTESGVPNEGLLRFKETHESISSLRYSFSWNAEPIL